MGTREHYTPGTFSWVDLVTTDPPSAKAFYGELFGWTANDMPTGDAGVYTMLQCDGDDVAALYEMDPARRAMGIPPHWFSYITVEDADAAAARAREAGGTILAGPFDVMDSGRMVVVQDPTGATFGAWQPGTHIGARRVNDPGCLTWNELQTREPEVAIAFYGQLFGWELERMEEDGKLAYVMIRNGDRANGGMMPMTEAHGDAPPAWLPYFTVPSTDEAAVTARKLGGGVFVEPFDLPNGRIAVVHDPEHAVFALFEGEVDD